MFITAVCIIFLIKLRWPNNKSLYDESLLNSLVLLSIRIFINKKNNKDVPLLSSSGLERTRWRMDRFPYHTFLALRPSNARETNGVRLVGTTGHVIRAKFVTSPSRHLFGLFSHFEQQITCFLKIFTNSSVVFRNYDVTAF